MAGNCNCLTNMRSMGRGKRPAAESAAADLPPLPQSGGRNPVYIVREDPLTEHQKTSIILALIFLP